LHELETNTVSNLTNR